MAIAVANDPTPAVMTIPAIDASAKIPVLANARPGHLVATFDLSQLGKLREEDALECFPGIRCSIQRANANKVPIFIDRGAPSFP